MTAVIGASFLKHRCYHEWMDRQTDMDINEKRKAEKLEKKNHFLKMNKGCVILIQNIPIRKPTYKKSCINRYFLLRKILMIS